MSALWIAAALALPGDADARGEHARQRDLFGPSAPPDRLPAPGPMGVPTPGPDARVYGYLAYWDDDLNQVPWDDLTDIAVFSANVDTAGNLSSTGNWSQAGDAVLMAQPYGVRVHLCVTNFSSSQLETLLGSAAAKSNLISQLETWVASTGAHGVNIDFENLPLSRKQQMVDFTADLDAAFDDVVLAVPAVDWDGAWDFDALTAHADLFIMGYDYHWAGSSESGPSDPLYGGPGTVWASDYALDWTVGDYLFYGANPDRVILGLPLYGRAYVTANNNVPTASQGDAGTVLWATAQSELAANGGGALEPGARSRYYRIGSDQHWVNDVETMRERIQFAMGEGLAGVGFWALNYDDEDAALWAMVRAETTTGAPPPPPPPPPDDTGDPVVDTDDPPPVDTDDPPPVDTGDPPPLPVDPQFTAVGGRPLLAYVGDTVVLTAEGSAGPEGVPLVYTWTQRSGPPVGLVGGDTVNPSFVVPEPGNYVFAVRVGDGATVISPPAESHVVAIDPSARGTVGDARGCGCAAGGSASGILLVAGLLAVRRRARRA